MGDSAHEDANDASRHELTGARCTKAALQRKAPDLSPKSAAAHMSHHLAKCGVQVGPRRPLSRGSSPSGCPAEPLVSYQINRQLSGWNLPPPVIRAFRAHCQKRTLALIRAGSVTHQPTG